MKGQLGASLGLLAFLAMVRPTACDEGHARSTDGNTSWVKDGGKHGVTADASSAPGRRPADASSQGPGAMHESGGPSTVRDAGARDARGGPTSNDAAADATSRGPCPLARAAGATRFEQRRWNAPETVVVDARVALGGQARVALDDRGDGAFVWLANDGARYHVWARRYDGVSGAAPDEQLDEPTPPGTPPLDRSQIGQPQTVAGDSFAPEVAAADNGDIIVTWTEAQGTIDAPDDRVYYRRYTRAAGWSQRAECPCGGTLAMDEEGNALAAWADRDGLRANHYDVGTGWAAPRRLDEYDGSVAVAFGRANGFVAWGTVAKAVRIQSFATESGWGEVKEFTGMGRFATPTVGVDACGNAVAAWQAVYPSPDLVFDADAWSANYDPETGWSGQTRLLPVEHQIHRKPAIAVSPSGRAAVAFDDGTVAFETGLGQWGIQPVGVGQKNLVLGTTRTGDLLAASSDEETVSAHRFATSAGWLPAESVGPGRLLDAAVSGDGTALILGKSGVALWVARLQ